MIKCSENIQQIYWRAPMPKCDLNLKLLYNFIEIALRHGCSPVNLLHVFKTLLYKNTYGGLLLYKDYDHIYILYYILYAYSRN